MKKLLSLALALTLVFAMSAPALAANGINGSATGDTQITATVGASYVVTIPHVVSITAGTENTVIGSITLSDAVLAPSSKVTVTADVAANGAGQMTHGTVATTKLAYTMKIGDVGASDAATISGAVATNKAEFTASGSQAVVINIAAAAWNAAPAGTYSDTITFTVAYA